MSAVVDVAERGLLPDWVVRVGIRSLLRQRLRVQQREANGDLEAALADRLATMRESPIALVPDAANNQHYEVPAAFFQRVLGPRLKYSCGMWSQGAATLAEAEEAMLDLTCQRAGIADGMRVLDLGCGWGALALWMAEHYPSLDVVAVSNAEGQRRHIEGECRRRGLGNVTVLTGDINTFVPVGRFDRILSVEMFEHMRNYERLLGQIKQWLQPTGRLFVHVFCHRRFCYFFETNGDTDWMARHFFTGGMMPSDDLLYRVGGKLVVEQQWRVNGGEYARTARAWLRNLDTHRAEVDTLLAAGRDPAAGRRDAERWRLFFLACAELFAYRGGDEWMVSHYLLRPSEAATG